MRSNFGFEGAEFNHSSHSSAGLAPLPALGSRYNATYTGYAGSTDPSYYSAYSNQSSSHQIRHQSVDSQKTHTTQADTDSQPSPTRSTKSSSTLSIPKTIELPQKDLSEVAAEVACLFWFDRGSTLDHIENSNPKITSPVSLSSKTIPADDFRKWLTGLLNTTQVAKNVIILALLFIYRLKKINPGVVGNRGSEFRLVTVALMLGNKFLDDNTYTNKTWAEVSGIPVNEVHTMEVEFLSNMKFSLFTSEGMWLEWHAKLGRFGTAINSFIKQQEAAIRLSYLAPGPSPVRGGSMDVYGSNGMGFMGAGFSQTHTPVLLPQLSSSAISPIGSLPELSFATPSRKRYYDDTMSEHPAKRQHIDYPSPLSSHQSAASLPPLTSNSTANRLTLPSLTIPSTIPNQSNIAGLPLPNSRAMSLVYPPIQTQHMPVSQSGSSMIPSMQTTCMPNSAMVAMDPNRQLSPYPISGTSSPVSANPHHSSSPSFYLGARQSPYRPVRQVKTLLVPPRAPTSIYNAPRLAGLDHLQYHSLGQPLNERHMGHVPYMHRDAWPNSNQPHQWPLSMQHTVSRG
ncbi:hypothetical protein BT63DRAFT_372460 [Microthyrium microscopicum]|uniref:Cyclin-domain-containing protein n=1 Tax=Microthyrium microscopicum TaxID=703497 RepID=A0A6A6UEB2_9PEZI|nr:hypothetical protein BT63DRAFT_372460 [Microthyrium microscopicum]